ncbi:hypothetical protein HDV05_004923 [Chytridiales sp. JEL 0842]|nr:hypothetical protein HDV05_004923 [Chytridiales sp. JEL 0842]
MNYLVKERYISALLDEYFNPVNLLIDPFLSGKLKEDADHWIPISVFAASGRLGILANDEAVVAKALRQNSKRIEVSEDGMSIRPKLDLQLDAAIDVSKTIYVEYLPPFATLSDVETYFSQFGKVTGVYVPMNCHLHSPPPNEAKELDEGVVVQPHKAKAPGYAFVVFAKGKEMKKVVHGIQEKWVRLRMGDDAGAFFKASRKAAGKVDEGETGKELDEKVAAWNFVRVMTMTEWTKRTEEYRQHMKSERGRLQQVMSSKVGTHEQVKYHRFTVARFTGVHRNTNRKVLKDLFELVAPVSYISYEKGQTTGHVRFKTKNGAALACTFFAREHVTQANQNDTGTLLSKVEQKNMQQKKVKEAVQGLHHEPWIDYEKIDNEGKPVGDMFVRLQLLKGQEEADYWDELFAAQQRKKAEQKAFANEDRVAPKTCLPQEEHAVCEQSMDVDGAETIPTEPKAKRKKKVAPKRLHVRFDSDDDKEEDEEFGVVQPLDLGNADSVLSGGSDGEAKTVKKGRTRKRGNRRRKGGAGKTDAGGDAQVEEVVAMEVDEEKEGGEKLDNLPKKRKAKDQSTPEAPKTGGRARKRRKKVEREE